jgi:hypothetical protein
VSHRRLANTLKGPVLTLLMTCAMAVPSSMSAQVATGPGLPGHTGQITTPRPTRPSMLVRYGVERTKRESAPRPAFAARRLMGGLLLLAAIALHTHPLVLDGVGMVHDD